MLILALDTTTRAGSAAVVRDGIVLHEISGNPSQTHGQRLPGDLMRVLEQARVTLERIDLFAVAAGPGSFTGLRVGIATMQGLAMASDRRIVPISALEALARSAAGGGGHIAAWMDAQRGEVFAALYAPDGRTLVIEPSSSPPLETIERWKPRLPGGPLVFVGDGALRYRDTIAGEFHDRAAAVDPAPPLAGFVGRIAAEEPSRAVLPHAVVPIYIRRPDAELARARRQPPELIMAETAPVQIALVTEQDDDLDAVAALEAGSFTNPWTREMLARELARSDVTRLYVLRLPDRRVAAFCKCWLILDELHINTIAVDPERRRQGLARLLLRHVLADAAAAGARRATLEVRRSNEAALKLYEQVGFSVCAVRPRYYTQPEEDALILWREGLASGPADPIQNRAGPDPEP